MADPTGDTKFYGDRSKLPRYADKAVDFTKVTYSTDGSRFYAKGRFADLTSGYYGSPVMIVRGALDARFSMSVSKNNAMYMNANSVVTCKAGIRSAVDLTENSMTVSVPLSCLPKGKTITGLKGDSWIEGGYEEAEVTDATAKTSFTVR